MQKIVKKFKVDHLKQEMYHKNSDSKNDEEGKEKGNCEGDGVNIKLNKVFVYEETLDERNLQQPEQTYKNLKVNRELSEIEALSEFSSLKKG